MSENRSTFRLQDYVSLGYLYLLLLGALRESVYYNFLGINFISYSDPLDILLGPIAYLASNPVIFLVFAVLTFLVFNQPRFHKRNREKAWYAKRLDVEKWDKVFDHPNPYKGLLPLLLLLIGSMMLGTGLGQGMKTGQKMKNGFEEYEDRITYLDGKIEDVKLLAQNSKYLFFVEPGMKKLTVAPIENVFKIQENIELEQSNIESQ